MTRVCKVILLAVCAFACTAALLLTPAIFGYRPCIVYESDSDQYPIGALVYYRYTPAELLRTGDVVVIGMQREAALYTITGLDGTAHTLSAGKQDDIPFPCVEGVVAFCIPYLGFLLETLRLPPVWITSAMGLIALLAGVFVLPRFVYQPRYGRKRGKVQNKTEGNIGDEGGIDV